MAVMDRLLLRVKESGGSDLHLSDGQPPRIRRLGQLAPLPDEPALGAGALHTLLKEMAPPHALEKCERGGESSFTYEIAGQLRARLNCYRHAGGLGAVGRLIPLAAPTLQDLALPPVLSDLAKLRSGLVLVTGTSGSGTSTTVAALLNEINATQNRRIETLEDPIEFLHAPVKSTIAQRDVHSHTRGAAAALREVCHQGCDVIFAGHLSTRENIALSVSAAEGGALVIGTLRANTTVRALEQIMNLFPTAQHPWIRAMLANSLRAVIVQTLATKADGSGRCAANEILIGTPGVASAIREGYVSKLGTMIQSGGMDGMINLDDSLMKKVQAEVITAAEALTKAVDKTRFQSMIKPPEPSPEAAATAPAPAGKGAPPVPAAAAKAAPGTKIGIPPKPK